MPARKSMPWKDEGISRSSGPGGVSMFTCKKCNFQTASEMNAVCHVRLCHAQVPSNYQCDSCGFRAASEDQLREHCLVKHALRVNKTYQCSECSFSSQDKMALMHHVHSMHYIAGCSYRKS